MQVSRFTATPLEVTFAGENLYRLAIDYQVDIYTDEGLLRWNLLAGFPTNMRSGSHAIDPVIPKFTDNREYNAALLCHDAAYTKTCDGEHYITKLLADTLLRQMVVLSGQLGNIRAGLMYRMLRMFGNSAYEEDNTGCYAGADAFMKFQWRDKK